MESCLTKMNILVIGVICDKNLYIKVKCPGMMICILRACFISVLYKYNTADLNHYLHHCK